MALKPGLDTHELQVPRRLFIFGSKQLVRESRVCGIELRKRKVGISDYEEETMSYARIENLTNIICPPFPQAIGHNLHEVDEACALLVTRGKKQYFFVSKKPARV